MEIDELKKQLSERTKQLEEASISILERNEEVARLRDEIKKHLNTIDQLELKIKDMERLLEEARANGAAGEDQLRDEIKKLLAEIE